MAIDLSYDNLVLQAMYRDVDGPTKPVEDLNKICHQIPIHLILGEVDDLM